MNTRCCYGRTRLRKNQQKAAHIKARGSYTPPPPPAARAMLSSSSATTTCRTALPPRPSRRRRRSFSHVWRPPLRLCHPPPAGQRRLRQRLRVHAQHAAWKPLRGQSAVARREPRRLPQGAHDPASPPRLPARGGATLPSSRSSTPRRTGAPASSSRTAAPACDHRRAGRVGQKPPRTRWFAAFSSTTSRFPPGASSTSSGRWCRPSPTTRWGSATATSSRT